MWGNGNVYSLLAGVQTGAVAMTTGVEDLQRTPNRSTAPFSASAPYTERLAHPCCLIPNSQGIKTPVLGMSYPILGCLSVGSQDNQTQQVTASAFGYYPELGGKTLQVSHTLEKHHGETSGY